LVLQLLKIIRDHLVLIIWLSRVAVAVVHGLALAVVQAVIAQTH
jgi:type III secretory pathway component EscS